MKKIIRWLGLIGISFALLGCSAEPFLLNTAHYTPSNTIILNGHINVGKFRYQLADTGYLNMNEISSYGHKTLLDTSVANYVQKATTAELQHGGMVIGNGRATLTGVIKELQINPTGENAVSHFKYTINYQLVDNQNGTILFNKDFSSTTKFTDFTATDRNQQLHKTIADGFNQFIHDFDARATLAKISQ